MHLQRKLRKGKVQTSQWSKVPLAQDQLEYAASDTYVGLEILQHLVNQLEGGSAHDPAKWSEETRNKLIQCSGSISTPAGPKAPKVPGPRQVPNTGQPTYMQSFVLWDCGAKTIDEVGALMRSPQDPLKRATIIGYLLRAIEAGGGASCVNAEMKIALESVLTLPEAAFTRNKYAALLGALGIGLPDKDGTAANPAQRTEMEEDGFVIVEDSRQREVVIIED